MTQTPNRRQYLKGIGLGAATIAGLSSTAAAKGHETLADPPGYLAVYQGAGGGGSSEPNTPEQFGFSDHPFFAAVHPGGGQGLVGGDIRLTPNRNTLHHSLQFFAGFVMEDDPKPYTLVNQGDGLFESRGQTINFTARSETDIHSDIEAILGESVANYLMYPPSPLPPSPLATLAGGTWRAVATDRMNVEVDDEEPFAHDAITRVDFYTRGRGRPEYTLSLLYVVWKDPDALYEDPFDPPVEIPEDTEKLTKELITDGRLNLGGQ